MSQQMGSSLKGPLALGGAIALGLAMMGYEMGSSLLRFKEFERAVSVKGLSEREVPADLVVWPIYFSGANSDLTALYSKLEADAKQIVSFLASKGFEKNEITVA